MAPKFKVKLWDCTLIECSLPFLIHVNSSNLADFSKTIRVPVCQVSVWMINNISNGSCRQIRFFHNTVRSIFGPSDLFAKRDTNFVQIHPSTGAVYLQISGPMPYSLLEKGTDKLNFSCWDPFLPKNVASS